MYFIRPDCGLQRPSAVCFQSDASACDRSHMRISRIFMILAYCAPHQPPRGRAAALGGPAYFIRCDGTRRGQRYGRGPAVRVFPVCDLQLRLRWAADAGERSTHSHILRSSVATERTDTGAAPVPDSLRKTRRCRTPKNQKPADQDQVKGEMAVGLFCIGI